MRAKKTFVYSLSVTVFGVAALLFSLLAVSPVYAQPLGQEENNGTCISCHENLYFLHDKGKYFCIRESPMRCVDCHGGDPSATTQESAHFNRSAHPVVNEDISRCQECHVDAEECCECLSKFEQVAGFKEVKLASRVPVSSIPDQSPSLPAFEEQQTVHELLTVQSLPLYLIAGLALTIYILYKIRHS